MIAESDNFFWVELAKATLKLVLASVLIGLFHQYDSWLMVFLLGFIALRLFVKVIHNFKDHKVLFIGMLFTGVFGFSIEFWGVTNGYWAYHDLSGGREFPAWLFLAWIMAFYFLYQLECRLVILMKSKSLKSKLWLTLWISMFFPVLGEIITINLGVWTYHLPFQFFGVPLYAILGLIVLHMLVNIAMIFICKKWNIRDPLYSLNEPTERLNYF